MTKSSKGARTAILWRSWIGDAGQPASESACAQKSSAPGSDGAPWARAGRAWRAAGRIQGRPSFRDSPGRLG
jgi:hypothetical protein